VHAKLGPCDEPLAAGGAGVLAPHVVALHVVLQGVLRLQHPAARRAHEAGLAVLVVHVSFCKGESKEML
jgi:hypothetical protein